MNELKGNLFTYLRCLKMSKWSNNPSFCADHEPLGTAEASTYKSSRSPGRLIPNFAFFPCFWLLLKIVHSILYCFSELFVTSQFLLSLNPTVFINSLAPMCLRLQCSHFFFLAGCVATPHCPQKPKDR